MAPPLESQAERRLRLTRDFARRIVEAMETHKAPNADAWRAGYERQESSLGRPARKPQR